MYGALIAAAFRLLGSKPEIQSCHLFEIDLFKPNLDTRGLCRRHTGGKAGSKNEAELPSNMEPMYCPGLLGPGIGTSNHCLRDHEKVQRNRVSSF